MTNPFQNPFAPPSPPGDAPPVPGPTPTSPPAPTRSTRVRKGFGWAFLALGVLCILAAQTEWGVPREAISMTLLSVAFIVLGVTMVWKPITWKVAGPAIAVVLVASVIASPPSEEHPAVDAAATTSTTAPSEPRTSEVSSASSSASTPDAPKVLAAVPVGTPQHISGENKDKSVFEGDVTVTDVIRTSDADIQIEVTVKVTKGTMPLGSGWQLEQDRGAAADGTTYDDGALPASSVRTASGVVSFNVTPATEPSTITFTPNDKVLGDSVNDTAVWTVGTVTTSLTPTPEIPTYDNLPNADLPNVHVPHRRSGGCRRSRWC